MDTPGHQKTLLTLDHLIEALMDGQKGYRQAADEARDADLKTLFGEYSAQRAGFTGELQSEVSQLGGGEPESSGSVTSAIHRGWINLKSSLTSQDRHGILAECERGEDSAVKSYREALAEGNLSASAKAVVQRQYDGVLSAHNAIRKLRDDSTPAK